MYRFSDVLAAPWRQSNPPPPPRLLVLHMLYLKQRHIFTSACVQVSQAHQELGQTTSCSQQALPEQTVSEVVAKLDDMVLRQHALLQEAQVFEPSDLLYPAGESQKGSQMMQHACFGEQY